MKIKTLNEDEYLIIVDKPAGILAHPTLAKEKETLASWLINKYPGIEKLNWPDKTRVGIVHRLDKDTSGIVLMAKNPEVLAEMQKQFKDRDVEKIYLALVAGKVKNKKGEIEAAISRGENGLQKIQDAVYSFSKNTLRPAITDYGVLKYYQYELDDLTLLEVKPKTGRMHQIRVHLKYINHPVIGDQLYNTKLSKKVSKKLGSSRQFLHAKKIEFNHPITHKLVSISSNLPSDLENILNKLKKLEL